MTTELDEIREFIIDQSESFSICMRPLTEIEGVFENLGYEKEYEENPLNGWEVSFWYHYIHPTRPRYTVTGSLWYGEFKIYKDEKDITEKKS